MYIENFSTVNDVLKDFCKTLCEEGLEDSWTLEYPDNFDSILETRKAVISTSYPLIDIKSINYNKDSMILENNIFLIKDLDFEEVLEIKCEDLIFYKNKKLDKLENLEYYVKNDVIYIKFDHMKDEEISIKYKDRKKANLKWFVEFNYPEKITVDTEVKPTVFGKVTLPTEQNNYYYIEWKYGKYMDEDGNVFFEKTSTRTSNTFRCFWHSLNNINKNGYWHDPNYPNAHLTYIISFDRYTIAFSIRQTQFTNFVSGFSYIGMIDYANPYLGNFDNFGSSGNVLLSHNNLQKRVGIIPKSDNESDIDDFNYSLVIDWSKHRYGTNGVTNILYNYNDFMLTITRDFYKIFSFNSYLGQYRIGNCPELDILYETNKQKITISFKKEAFLQNNIYRFFFGMDYNKTSYFSGVDKQNCYSIYPFSLYIKNNYTNSSQRSFYCPSYYFPCLQNMGVAYLAYVNEYVNEYYDYYNKIYKNDYNGYYIYPFLVVNANNLEYSKIFKTNSLCYYSNGYLSVSPKLHSPTLRPRMEDFLVEREKDKFWFEAVKSELNNSDASFELCGGIAAKKLKKYNISSYSSCEFDSNNYKKLTTKSSFVDKTLLSKIGIQDNKNIILGYLRRVCSLDDKNSYDGKKFVIDNNEEYVTLKRVGCKDLINNMSNNIFQQVLLKKDN